MTVYPYFWLGMMILFLVAEAASVGLVSLWFAAGALAALAAALMGGSILVQVILFLLVSALLLALLRPVARKFLVPRIVRTNVDSVIGTMGYVTAPVDNIASTGQVKLGAMTWTARSASGDPIPEGTQVRVQRIEGVKVFVSPVTEPTPAK